MTNDQQILEQLRAGTNGKALAQLYRHLPAIRRMIRFYGGDRQQAEDVFQESLIILCRKAKDEGFKLNSGIYPYLHSVCRFLWQDELKRLNRRPVVYMEIGENDFESPGIPAGIEEEVRYKLAERIITELGDRCRELLTLFYNGGIKLREIAARMGYSSEQTAKNQKYKCLEGARDKYRREMGVIQSQKF